MHRLHFYQLLSTLQTKLSNEIKVAGNRSARFRVTTVAQLSFYVTLRMTSYLNQRNFFEETIVFSFM